MTTIDKIYVGREEAWEMALERGIVRLPRSGREIWTVPPIAAGRPTLILGKDEQGYYLAQAEGR